MKKIFLTFAFLLLSSFASAEGDSCGLDENGNINPYSFEICKEDTSFNMVYSLLGFLYEDYVFPFNYTEFIDKERTEASQKESTQYYMRFGIIFKDIFRAMNYITMAILFILLSYFTVAAIFNSASGDFLGKTWDKAGSLKRFMIGGILLTPINGISVIQILILNLSLFSISGANFVVSGFLGFMENRIPEISEQGDFDSIIDSNAEKSIYFDYALLDIKNLTKVAMCRNRTSQYLLEKKVTTNGDNKEFINCNSPSPILLASKDDISGFVKYNYQKEDTYFVSTGVEFGNKLNKECNTDITTEYKCGEVNFPNSNIDLRDYNISSYDLDKKIIEIANSINYSTSMNEKIYDEWKTFWEFLKSQGKYYKSTSVATQASKYKIASYYFHQMIQTHKSVGILFGKDEMETSWWSKPYIKESIIIGEDTVAIQDRMKLSNNIAKNIESLSCIKNYSLLIKTMNAKEKIENETDSIEVSSQCLYNDAQGRLEVLGLINGELPFVNKETAEEDLLKIKEEETRLIDESEVDIRLAANKLYMLKKSIMDSFNASIENPQGNDKKEGAVFENNLLVQARQLGWGSFGSLMRRIIQEKDGEEKLRKSLLTGLEYVHNTSSSMVSLDINQTDKKYPNLKSEMNRVFNSFYNNRKVQNVENLSINKHLNSYIEQKQDVAVGGNILESDLYHAILNAPTLIVNSFKKQIGIERDTTKGIGSYANNMSTPSEYMEGQEKSLGMSKLSGSGNVLLEDCIKGINSCGIPIIHPMETITKLGKDLIVMSTSIMAFSMGKSMAATKANKRKAAATSSDKGAITGTKKLFKSMGPMGHLLGGNVFSYITDFLVAFFWILFVVGFVAAYVLPLIPFFIFTIALIGWIIILFQVLIISNIWIVLFFQPRSQGENKEGIQAAYNALMQLLLRPALITVSLILGWWIFSVLIMIVNLSIGPLFSSLTAQEHLMGLINVTFGLTFYIMIIYIVLKLAFKIIEELPKKVFAVLGVTADTEDQNQFKAVAEAMINYKLVQSATSGQLDKEKGKERQAYNEYQARKQADKENGGNDD
jgi:conjugal transfer/type IV secretion protein DotA/TraY